MKAHLHGLMDYAEKLELQFLVTGRRMACILNVPVWHNKKVSKTHMLEECDIYPCKNRMR